MVTECVSDNKPLGSQICPGCHTSRICDDCSKRDYRCSDCIAAEKEKHDAPFRAKNLNVEADARVRLGEICHGSDCLTKLRLETCMKCLTCDESLLCPRCFQTAPCDLCRHLKRSKTGLNLCAHGRCCNPVGPESKIKCRECRNNIICQQCSSLGLACLDCDLIDEVYEGYTQSCEGSVVIAANELEEDVQNLSNDLEKADLADFHDPSDVLHELSSKICGNYDGWKELDLDCRVVTSSFDVTSSSEHTADLLRSKNLPNGYVIHWDGDQHSFLEVSETEYRLLVKSW